MNTLPERVHEWVRENSVALTAQGFQVEARLGPAHYGKRSCVVDLDRESQLITMIVWDTDEVVFQAAEVETAVVREEKYFVASPTVRVDSLVDALTGWAAEEPRG